VGHAHHQGLPTAIFLNSMRSIWSPICRQATPLIDCGLPFKDTFSQKQSGWGSINENKKTTSNIIHIQNIISRK
jgi:hypothetical protein